MTNKKLYITTPIYYANGSPHIGHFLTTTVGDVLVRYHRELAGGVNTFFTTGLDEHGQNVAEAAKKLGLTDAAGCQKFVDEKAVEWQAAFDKTQISYDYFVRTTHPEHKKFVHSFIRKLIAAGDVYKADYEGKYCYGCEKFLTLSDLNEEGYCPLHRPDQVIPVKEQNYFFRSSKYADKIKELIETDQLKIHPETKKKEILGRIAQGIEDTSISRPKEKLFWGIDFPDDPDQIIYVWVDALINYLSSLEINGKQEFWDVTVHLLAKDINWFHNFIWPALLLSAGYPVFKESFVHSYLSISGEKISKSKGNVITPTDLEEKYGVDGARYLILTCLPYKDDFDVTWASLDEKYNADLANGLGNAVARITRLIEKSGLAFEEFTPAEDFWDQEIFSGLSEFRPDVTLATIWQKLSALDKHINDHEPWKITDTVQLQGVLAYELGELRDIVLALKPFLPTVSSQVLEAISGSKPTFCGGLFPRI